MASKTDKVIYWIATGITAAFILPGMFFMNAPMAIEGARQIGIPEWLRLEVGYAQPLGALLILIPQIPHRFKEWGYVGLGIVYLTAMIAHLSLEGMVAMSFSPLINFGILLISYIYYYKVKKN